jgi:hypothetical protein
MSNLSNFLLPSVLAAAAGVLLSFGYAGAALFFGLGALILSIETGTSAILRQMKTNAD